MTIKIVVPVSGGKDSQACLQLALESYPTSEVIGLFCDTGWEHPITYNHIDWIAQHYGVEIRRLSAETVQDKVRKYQIFPAPLVRFCTDELKIVPSKNFYRDLADLQGGFEVWYGMRSGESADRAKRYMGKIGDEVYPPHDVLGKYPKYLFKKGVMFRLPILDWSTQDVFDYLDGKENPLYIHGFDRVGCFPCPVTAERHHQRAFNFDAFGAAQKARVEVLEQEIGKKHTPANTAQICMFCQI